MHERISPLVNPSDPLNYYPLRTEYFGRRYNLLMKVVNFSANPIPVFENSLFLFGICPDPFLASHASTFGITACVDILAPSSARTCAYLRLGVGTPNNRLPVQEDSCRSNHELPGSDERSPVTPRYPLYYDQKIRFRIFPSD